MEETKVTPRIRMNPRADVDAATADVPHRSDTRTVRISIAKETKPPHAGESSIAQYSITEKIGDGGMGVVFLARDRKLGRNVAIKRLNKMSQSRPALRERFLREAKVVAALSHIHIVHVYALGEDEDGPFIVMEYVAGPQHCSPDKSPPAPFSLADRVHREGPMSMNDALDLTIKLCRAVQYAHSCGVIHRDLKPSNVLLDETYEPKIVDFGLARVMNAGEDQITVPGEKMLSLGYGAPEQELDATLCDERSDVYGLGALLYFSITGQNPRYFRENAVPDSLRIPIVKALETDRTMRWANVLEFLDSLLLIKAPSTVIVPITKTTWRCRWCDTVNSIALQYCSRCGWDGATSCIECGSSSRVGVQFCGKCGADARDYEAAVVLIQRLKLLKDDKAHELVVQHAGKITGFHPSGQNGARLLEETTQLKDEALRAMSRQAQLRQDIKDEMVGENYERARELINEYISLSVDNTFAADLRQIPDLTLKRELKRAHEAIDEHNYAYAARVCHAVLEKLSPGNADAKLMLVTIHRMQWIKAVIHIFVVVLILAATYLLSAAPALHYAGGPEATSLQRMYTPAKWISEKTFLKTAMRKYAGIWEEEPAAKPATTPMTGTPSFTK